MLLGAICRRYAAAKLGDVEVLDLLLSTEEGEAAVNAAAVDGSTPLGVAAAMGRDEAVDMLVDAGADVDSVDSGGRSAL